jgi:hypothetical protein
MWQNEEGRAYIHQMMMIRIASRIESNYHWGQLEPYLFAADA